MPGCHPGQPAAQSFPLLTAVAPGSSVHVGIRATCPCRLASRPQLVSGASYGACAPSGGGERYCVKASVSKHRPGCIPARSGKKHRRQSNARRVPHPAAQRVPLALAMCTACIASTFTVTLTFTFTLTFAAAAPWRNPASSTPVARTPVRVPQGFMQVQ